MPAYKNRPHIDPDTTVWRYMCLDAVVSTLRDRKLRLTRVDTFRDPFEGSVPKQQIDDQVVLFSHTYRNRATWSVIAQSYPPGEIYVPHDWGEDPWIRMTRLRRARTRSIHASCWSWGEESEALWRLYCTHDGASGIGIAVRTTSVPSATGTITKDPRSMTKSTPSCTSAWGLPPSRTSGYSK